MNSPDDRNRAAPLPRPPQLGDPPSDSEWEALVKAARIPVEGQALADYDRGARAAYRGTEDDLSRSPAWRLGHAAARRHLPGTRAVIWRPPPAVLGVQPPPPVPGVRPVWMGVVWHVGGEPHLRPRHIHAVIYRPESIGGVPPTIRGVNFARARRRLAYLHTRGSLSPLVVSGQLPIVEPAGPVAEIPARPSAYEGAMHVAVHLRATPEGPLQIRLISGAGIVPRFPNEFASSSFRGIDANSSTC